MWIWFKWFGKYYKEVGKDIGTILLKGKWIEIAYLIISTSIGFYVDITKKYIESNTNINVSQIPTPVLNGLLSGITILVIVIIWSLFLYTPMRIFRTNRERIGILEERQKTNLEIIFNETSKDHCSEYVQNNGQTWGISVHNKSTITSIKNVTVKLTEVYEGLSLVDDRQVCLKFARHDKRYVDICAGDEEPVNVFIWIKQIGEDKKPRFDICHIEDIYPYLIYDIDKDDYKIKIVAFGDETSPEPRYFKVGLKDGMIKMEEVKEAVKRHE